MFKKFMAVVLAMILTLSLIPTGVFAEVVESFASLTIVNNGSVDREYHVIVNDAATENEATPDEIITVKAGESVKYEGLSNNSTYTVEQMPFDDPEYAYIESQIRSGVLENSDETFFYYTEAGQRVDVTEDEYNSATDNGSNSTINGYYDENSDFNTDCKVFGSTGYLPDAVAFVDAPVISNETVSGSWIKTYKCTATYTYNNTDYVGNGTSIINANSAKSDAVNKAFNALSAALGDNFLEKDSSTNAVSVYVKVDLVTREYVKENIVTTADEVLEFNTNLKDAPKGSLDINYAVITEDGKNTPDTDATFGLYDMDGNLVATAAQNNVSLLGSGYTKNSFSDISAGKMPGTQYYVQQITAPLGFALDKTKYFFTVNRDGSVTAGDNSTISTTSLFGTVTNTLYNTTVSVTKLFTNEIRYEETELVLTKDRISVVYNKDDADNEAIKQAVLALIDEENSTLPSVDSRTYQVETKNLLGVWGNLPAEPLDAGDQTVRVSISAKGYYTARAEVTVSVAPAKAELSINSQTVTYGDPMPSDLVVTDPEGVLTATMFVGLNTTDETVVEPYLGVVLPDLSLSMMAKYPELAAVKAILGTNASVNDVADVLKLLVDDEATKEMIDSLLDYIPDSVKEISVSSTAPTQAGVYVTAALCIDKNYTAELPAMGVYTIKPETGTGTLSWNQKVGPVILYWDMDSYDYSAAFMKDTEATDINVKYIWLVMDPSGKVDIITDPSYVPDKSAAYTQIAYVTGSELAAPISRIIIVPMKLLGDADMSGRVTISDATQIQMYLAKLVDSESIDLELADVNCDGTVDIMDATLIQMFLARIIHCYDEV